METIAHQIAGQIAALFGFDLVFGYLILGVLLGFILGRLFGRRRRSYELGPRETGGREIGGRKASGSIAASARPDLDPALVAEIRRLMDADRKIDAIKHLRVATGLDLAEAKQLVEYLDEQPRG